MKIAYVGNFTQQHCTEVHLAATLESLGHEVLRIQENGDGAADRIAGLGVAELVDLFLFTRTWGETVTLDHLARLRERKIPTASYHLDLYVGLSRKYLHGERGLAEVLHNDPFWRTDFVFTPDGDPSSAEVFKDSGVNHYYMRPGVFKPECEMYEPSNKDSDQTFYEGNDVLFVGGGDRPGSPSAYGHPEWNYRNELVAWLMDTYGHRFTKYGHPEATVRNLALNKLYKDSKVVVGDSVCLRGFTQTYYWSDRVYETIGRGGFMIHPYIKGLDEEFVDGETIVFYEYGNWSQLKEKIDYYLEHDEERERIRRAGHEFVKNNATYTERLTRTLDIIFPNGWPTKVGDQLLADQNYLMSSVDAVPHPSSTLPIKINLGAGSEPTEGWINTDWIEGPGIDLVFNLLKTPWPFADGGASDIKAIDVLEHMPNFTADNRSTPIAFIEECHRILKPGGKLFITVPHWQSPNLWIDPTHVRGYDEKSMDYFDPEKDHGKWYGYYSQCKFEVSSVRTPNDNVEFTMIKKES